MILVPQDELEAQLAHAARQRFPQRWVRKYVIVGTVELQTFKKSIEGRCANFRRVADHVSDSP